MTDGQKTAFEKYWPDYGLSLHDGSLDAAEQFGRNAPQVLEIGFGMGGSLLQMVQAEPDKDFIGIEVHPPGVGRLINDAGKLELPNLRVFLADAIDVLEDCIADASIDRFQIYFPDPWHKKKHNKRRLIHSGFIQKVAAKLNTAGICHMATDWEPYAEHMMETMSAAEQFENTQGDYLFSERPDFRPVTKFERRGDRLGHGVWDLLFRKR